MESTKNGVPQAPGGVPVLGHMAAFLRAPLAFLRELPAHGDLVEIRLAGHRMVVVCDPELTRTMLVRDRVFDKGGPMYDRLREAGGHGVASCPSVEHRRQRRLVQPAFHHSRLPGYARIMTACVEEVVGGWRDGRRVDLMVEIRKITAGVVISAVFGTGLDPAVRAHLAADFNVLMSGLGRRTLMPSWLCALPTPGNVRYRRATGRIRRIMAEVIADHRRGGTGGEPSLLSLLIDARDPGSEVDAFTDGELVDQAVTMYTAGTETTASAVCWALHLTARHPEAQERLRAEARTVLAGRTATWEDLPRLPYTRQVFAEALRMYPPGWLLTRETATDTRLGRYDLPAGTTVAYSPYLIGRLPALHQEPDRFDPGRWEPQSGERAPRAPKAPTTVFGDGARKCAGDEFALVEGVLLLASLASRRHIELQPAALRLPRLPGLALNPGRMPATVTSYAAPHTPHATQAPYAPSAPDESAPEDNGAHHPGPSR
ncbi:cytochrome P450 [Streptomyces sp. NPDC051567]|uniref:cytochrome P450 n=1 Tax=Streptomyces sp. NPDC051567 TaxID=3365660 RepID=UPI00379CA1FD